MPALIVNSKQTLQDAVKAITDKFEKDKYVQLTIHSGKRTLSQDALCHVGYKQVADHLGLEASWIKSECKYHIGLPILAKDRSFDAYIVNIRKALRPLLYEDRIKYMDYIKVTSLMSTKQEAEYYKEMQKYYEDNIGLVLECNRKK